MRLCSKSPLPTSFLSCLLARGTEATGGAVAASHPDPARGARARQCEDVHTAAAQDGAAGGGPVGGPRAMSGNVLAWELDCRAPSFLFAHTCLHSTYSMAYNTLFSVDVRFITPTRAIPTSTLSSPRTLFSRWLGFDRPSAVVNGAFAFFVLSPRLSVADV